MKTQHKIKAGNYHTKKKWNRKNQKRHQQIAKHFSKRNKKIEVWKKEAQREIDELYKVHQQIAKHYELTRPEEKDTRSLEERAKEMRQMKNKVIDTTQMELAWSKFAREQRDNNRKHRVVLHTGEEL